MNTFFAISDAIAIALVAAPVAVLVVLLGLRRLARRRLAKRKHAGLRILK